MIAQMRRLATQVRDFFFPISTSELQLQQWVETVREMQAKQQFDEAKVNMAAHEIARLVVQQPREVRWRRTNDWYTRSKYWMWALVGFDLNVIFTANNEESRAIALGGLALTIVCLLLIRKLKW